LIILVVQWAHEVLLHILLLTSESVKERVKQLRQDVDVHYGLILSDTVATKIEHTIIWIGRLFFSSATK